jgi:hypothetical protein
MEEDATFAGRQYRSMTDRRKIAAKIALESLVSNAQWALKELENGRVPNSDLSGYARRYQEAVAGLEALMEYREVAEG